jgi:SAM-dependent methyltransferase
MVSAPLGSADRCTATLWRSRWAQGYISKTTTKTTAQDTRQRLGASGSAGSVRHGVARSNGPGTSSRGAHDSPSTGPHIGTCPPFYLDGPRQDVKVTYYREDLARVHHEGFGFHADLCAPGILRLLEPVLARGGVVLELGCGSGLLTRYLVEAGHRVIATDASPAMLALARSYVPGAESIEQLTLPDDDIPDADAVVSIGHVLCYLPDERAVWRGLEGAARAVRPGGVLAVDLCDLEWGRARQDAPAHGWVSDDWALITHFFTPTPTRFVRQMAIFTRNDDGTWRRDDERHANVLIGTATIPAVLSAHGMEAIVSGSFGGEELPTGLRAVIGRRPSL